MSWFNPNFAVISQQMTPYTLQGKFTPGDGLNFKIQREPNESSKFGYECGLDLKEDSVAISPCVQYQLNDDIGLNSSLTIDTD